MFHRVRSEKAKNQTAQKASNGQNQNTKHATNNDNKTGQNFQAMDQTAVRQYAKPQEQVTQQTPSANVNSTKPYAVKQNQNSTMPIEGQMQREKEVQTMNNPEKAPVDNAQNNQPQGAPQGGSARVDIPGQNFQRPNPAGGRPAYPGAAYPGAQGNAASAPTNFANDVDNSRKLVIGQGITMSGEIESCDHLIVQGTIEASLKGANVLDVAESGSYFGTVEIEEANIAGRFEGDITVNGRLTIESTGTIIGSVTYKELSMEAGATLDGSVSPIGSENAAKKAKTAPKSKKVSQNNNGAELPFANQAAE
jgi:cytoskeletal protein CcmA (bactofilin family)